MLSKSFTDLFIRKPVIALVVNIVILVVGVLAYFKLNTRQYPRSDSSVVSVSTIYFGASAETVRGYITTQLERVIASADGIDYIESSSSAGLSTINVYLRPQLRYQCRAGPDQLQDRQVRSQLPPEAEVPVISVQTADNQFASMYISFYSETMDQNQITDYLDRMVQPRLAAVKGVQRAEVLGGRVFAMRVWLKPDELAAHNLSPSEVRQALQANNALAAVGSTKGSMLSVSLVANTDLKDVEQFKRLVVAERNGTVIRLADVADVVLGAENYDTEVRFGGETATFMGIWVLPTESTVEVIKRVRDTMPDIERSLPGGLKVSIAYDASKYISDALHEIVHTLLETLLIVTIVIFLFMGSFRSVFIPIVAMPLSLVGAMILMLAFGFTINLLTLLAIVLAVGIVVDDAIVVVENVERHIREGRTPVDAAILGARELVGPVISMTITLAAVYAPIAFQGGLTGALFREFAMTLAGAVMVSGFVALTLSPMMSAYMLKGGKHEEEGFTGWTNHLFDRLRNRYDMLIGASLNLVPVTITAAFLLTLLLLPFFMFAQKELAPKEDQGVVFSILQPSPTSTLEQNVLYAQQVQKMFAAIPEYEQSFQLTSAQFGFSGVLLKPWSERKRNAVQIQEALQGPAAAIPGLNVIVTTPEPLPSGGQFPIEFVMRSTADHKEMLEYAQKLTLYANTEANAGGGAPTFYFADTDLKFDLPQGRDRHRQGQGRLDGPQSHRCGPRPRRDAGRRLRQSFHQRRPELPRHPAGRARPAPQCRPVARLPCARSGRPADPLSTIATLKDTVQPRTLNRFQQLNAVKITGVGPSIDLALKKLEAKAKEILPPGYSVDYGGQSRQLRYEGNALWTAFALAGVLIFLVLAAQFNSFRDPFVILLGSVPLALVGAMLPIFLWKTSLNIYSQIGLITLVGLVAKNGILIVEFANGLQEQGLSKRDAIRRAAATRLRPVMMTSAATVFGHLMLIFVSGPGAAARNSIGWVLVVGMAVGSVFTLFVVRHFTC
ncbi:MAG: efflux RND transporter permease subunit [Lacunisphaera sp.]